jgi:hypothetical protein
VIAATCNITFQAWANATQAVFGGTFTCPVTVTNLAHVIVRAFKGPLAVEIARFDSGFTSSGVIAYSGASNEILETGVSQTGWAVQFECYDANYSEAASPFTVSGLTIPAATITAISATDDTADRYQDLGGALHAIVPVTLSCSQYPQMVSLWTNSPQYGRIMHGWFWVTAASTVIRIGDKSTGTDIYPPTVAAETVTVYAAIGTYDGKIDPTTISGVASTTVSVSAPATMTSTSSSDASASVSYYTGAGGASDFLATILFTLNLEDPNFFFARLYVQTGAGTGGSFVPGGAHPVYHSADGTIGDWVSPNGFNQAADHGQGFSLVSTVAAGQIQATLVGPVPSDANTTLRLTLDVASRKDDGSGGTKVTQSTWPSGAAYLDLVLTGSLSNVLGSKVSGAVANATAAASVPGSGVSGTVASATTAGSASTVPGSGVSGTVASATTAGTASTAGYSTSAGSASTAGYSTSAGSATTAGSVPGSGVTGTVTLGGGGAATTVAQVKDAGGNVVCWMGQYVVSSVTYYGIWASNVWIGGSGPAAAKIWLDAYGNAHFSGSVESGSTITAPTISGGSLSITASTAVVSISSTTSGVDIALSGSGLTGFNLHYTSGDHITMGAGGGSAWVTVVSSYGYIGDYSAGFLDLSDSSGNSGAHLSGQTNGTAGLTLSGTRYATIGGYVQAGGVYVTGTYSGYGIYCPSYGIASYALTAGAGGISNSGVYSGGQFQGAGVSCGSYNVGGYSLSAGVGGISCNGYSVVNSSGQFVGNGVSCSSYGVTCYSVTVGAGGLSVSGSVSLSGTFSGTHSGTWSGSISPAGVSCPSYGVSCYSLTVGAGGLSVGGYSGSTNTITFTDSGGGYCKLNGSALRMEFNYGVFNGLI